MRFDEKYQLVDLKEDAEAKFFIARELSTGRQVTIFLFVGEQAVAQAALLQRLEGMDRSQFPELIETGKNQATPYVVTRPLSGFAELKAKASVSKPMAPPPPPPAQKGNEFAKAGVWHVPLGQKDHTSKPTEPAKPFSTPAETLRPEAPPVPGSFTQMFQTPAAPMGEAPPAVSEEPMASPEEHVSTEVSGLFPAPVARPPELAAKVSDPPAAAVKPGPEAPQPPAVEEPSKPTTPIIEPAPGEFTQLFQAPVAPAPKPAPVPAAPHPPATKPEPKAIQPPVVPVSPKQATAPESAPGEFTRLFQAPVIPAPEPTPTAPTLPVAKPEPKVVQPPVVPVTPKPVAPAPEPAPGEFTQLFKAPMAPAPEPAPKLAAPVVLPISQKPAPPAAPGSFTQMFQSPAAPMGEGGPAGVPPKGAPKPTHPSAKESGPGEFTRFFQSTPAPSEPVRSAPAPAGQGQFTKVFGGGSATPPTHESAGQFTSIFQTPAQGASTPQPGTAPAAPPPSFTAPSGAFTRVFGSPSMEIQAATPDEPQKPSAPGEYTRMFRAQSVLPAEEPTQAPVVAPVPEPSAATKQSSKLPLVMGGIIVLLVVLIVVLLIVLRK